MAGSKQISPINWEKAVANCGGDEEMFRQMLALYDFKTFDSYLRKAHKIIISSSGIDFYEIYCLLDAFRSPLLSIAADQCCKTILEIMTAAENEDVKAIQAKYLPLLRESKLLKSHIADLNHKQYDLSDIDNYIKEVEVKNSRRNAAAKLESQEVSTKKSECQSFCNQF